MNGKLYAIWNRMVGDKADFSLEGRIFHSVCLIVMLGTGLNVPFNYLIGLPALALLMLVILCIIGMLFYLSRFKSEGKTALVIFQVFNNLALIANYYYNSGLSGPSYVIFLLSLIISVVIIPRRQYWFWLPLNISIALALLITEQMRPGLIKNSYPHPNDRFIDFGYTYIMIAVLVLFILISIRNAYHEERRRAAYEAKALIASNETKNKLLSILAHDLKDPLASIQSFLELLSDYDIEETERINIEKELLVRTQNASQMLANVLTWSKSQMDGVQPQVRELNLAGTLASTLQLSKSIAAEKGIETQFVIPADICVAADADMLQLVIRNLVMNAIKFTYPGGKIGLNIQLADRKCTIMITDTGIGIPEEKKNTVFSLSDKTTYGTENEKGAGLGLVLCKNFIELQGGRIWFESKPGHGTSFFITLKECTVLKEKQVLQL
ncbi:MAG: HAMP domain-containing histidine kinase [Chitinophagaceae bacterium]|nr:MAG: HAMP domain-containing histidine kinase [Chitinophagaceae bacterium]